MEPQNTTLEPQTVKRLPKAGGILKQSFEYYKKDLSLIMGIFAIPLIFSLVKILNINPSLTPLISFLASIASYVATITFLYALTKGSAKQLDFTSAYSEACAYLLPAIWVAILSGLAFIGGVTLFVIPGLVAVFMLTFSVYIFFVEDIHGLKALIKSWYYVKGSFWNIVGKFLFFGIIVIIPFVLIAILSLPFSHTVIDPLNGNKIIILPIFSQVIMQFAAVLAVTPLSLIYSLSIFKLLAVMKEKMSEQEAARIKRNILALIIVGLVVVALLLTGLFFYINGLMNGTIHVAPAYRTASVLSAFNPLFNFVR